MPDPFWFNDFSILINPDRMIEFFPNNDFTTDEKLNSLVRLGAYIAIVFIMYKKDINWISILIFILLLTYYLHTNANIQENFDGLPAVITELPITNCTKPEKNNPFMNVTMGDLLNTDPNGSVKMKPVSCDPNNADIKKSIDNNFKNNLFRDVNDVFGKYNSQRQFFTMPWTDIIPDSEGNFKNWLYKQPETCHENPEYCIRSNYEDVRANS